MKIDLLPGEEVLRTFEGRQYQPNPIARIVANILRLTGSYTKVVVTLTSNRCLVEEQHMLLWAIPTARTLTIVSMEDISSVMGVKTSFLLVFKSFNLIVWSGGAPLVGVNFNRMTSSRMDGEINGLSILKQASRGIAA